MATRRSVVLSGFMATGKSTLGPLLATRLGLRFLDTDEELARRTRVPIPDLWRTRGESTFRSLEESLVRELFADGTARVLSFGGGTVTLRSVRHLVLDAGALLVTLTAGPDTIVGRIPDLQGRPALAGPDPLGRITSLLEQRASAYAECHLRVATDAVTPEEAVARIADEYPRDSILVPLGERTYPVHLVHDDPGAVVRSIIPLRASSLILVTDSTVRAARGAALDASLPGGVPRIEVTLPPGEEHKTLGSVERIWRAALDARVDRHAVMLAFGGGVASDLASFAASTLLRGLRVVQVPTTLLAMVDASVGGKTGFDLPQGKNLIGSFHQPSSVCVDLEHLSTLPRRELLAGLAEVAKIALACDAALWTVLEEHAESLRDGDLAALLPVARRSIALKSAIVRVDERESGPRGLLNLGHTVGHALEAAGGFARHRHGEAVAIGLVAEASAAEALGCAPHGIAARVEALVERLGLAPRVPAAEMRAAWPFVASDKKRAHGSVLLPLLSSIGAAAMIPVSLRDLESALGINPST